ncbi:MAG: hypothetical protein PHE65_05350 [Candidatus Omnitrophica bacterium]|nr:hypothetical protein [Candidatus Omnitrophota bacterium]
MKEVAKGFIVAGIIFSCVFVSFLSSALLSLYRGNSNIWWTHKDMMLSLGDVKNDLEIYIKGTSLSKLAEKERLFLDNGLQGQYKVVPADIKARVNNWDRRRVSILKGALFTSFGSGAGLVLLAVGLYLKFKKWPGV